MGSRFGLVVVAGGALALLGCSAFGDPDVQRVLTEQIAAMQAQGKLTAGQAEAATAAIAGSLDLKSTLMELLRSGIDIGLALLGVRLWRGGIANRKGAGLPIAEPSPVPADPA